MERKFDVKEPNMLCECELALLIRLEMLKTIARPEVERLL